MKNTISTQQFLKLIRNTKSATPATLTTVTKPRMVKFDREKRDEDGNKIPNPYYDRVDKVSIVNCFLNVNYENSVNRQRKREHKHEDFHGAQRAWGKHETPSVIEHKGTYKIQVKVERSIKSHYLLDQKPIDSSLIKPYLPKRSSTRQQLNKEVIIRTYNIENVYAISLKGNDYVIDHNL